MKPLDMEKELSACRLATPPTGLRARVLESVLTRKKNRRGDRLLASAVAMLLIVLGWAHFKEMDTARRMANTAAATPNKIIQRMDAREALMIAKSPLRIRLSLPLPKGCAFTEVRFEALSLDGPYASAVQDISIMKPRKTRG